MDRKAYGAFALAGSITLGLLLAPPLDAEDRGDPWQLAALTVAGVDARELEEMKGAYRRPGEIPFPEENPYSSAKAELGKMLFFDPRLSGSNLISCASCHNPSFAWEDGQPTGAGHGMNRLGRHTPTVLNLAWGEVFFWDGRADSLEEQALGPIQADVEMAQPLDTLIVELEGIAGYREAFEEAFPGQGITAEGIAMAIATYERTIVSGKAPFDYWIEGNPRAISRSAQRGFVIYNTKGRCAACHSGWNLTDDSFHDIGLRTDDVGREQVVEMPEFRHTFKTPGLRNIVQRAPYMHNGSLATLSEVVEHYDRGFLHRPSLSDDIRPLNLTGQEKADLVAFLETLTSEDEPTALPLLPN